MHDLEYDIRGKKEIKPLFMYVYTVIMHFLFLIDLKKRSLIHLEFKPYRMMQRGNAPRVAGRGRHKKGTNNNKKKMWKGREGTVLEYTYLG